MKPAFSLCIFFVLLLSSFKGATSFVRSVSEKADSLEVALVLKKDTEKPEILISLSELYQKRNPTRALEKANQALELSRQLNDKKLTLKSLMNIGMLNKNILSDYDQALNYGIQALRIAEKIQDPSLKAQVFFAIGSIYEDANDNYKALENYMQALVLQEQQKESSNIILSLNKLGIINSRLSNYEKALEYHQIALNQSREYGNLSLEASSLYYLAETQKLTGNLDEALRQHIEALQIFRKIKESVSEGHSLNRIGGVYSIKKNYERAIENYKVALHIHLANEDWQGVSESYNYIGQVLMAQNNYKQALPFLKKGLEYAETVNSKKLLQASYENLYTCHLGLKNFEEVIAYKNFYIGISELIVQEENSRELAEMQIKFEIEKKENEINALQEDKAIKELELEKEKRNKLFLIVFCCLILVIAGLLFHLYKLNRKNNLNLQATNDQINKQNLQLQELNATKDKFFGIISHDLKGPLNSLTSFSGLLLNHSQSLSKDEIQMLAKDLDKSLKTLFAFLENLLEWARSQTGSIDHKPETIVVKEVIEACFGLLRKSAENKQISLLENVSPELHVTADKNQFHTVIRNFISNAIKFTHQQGTVYIEAKADGTSVEIAVRDNGVGMKKEIQEKLFKLEHKHTSRGTANEKGTGLGLILCKEFIEKNGGSVRVESEEGKGSAFIFTLPKAEVITVNT